MQDKSRGRLIQLFIRLYRTLDFVADQPVTAGEISRASGIPLRRTYRWVQAMKEEGLLEEVRPYRGGNSPSTFRLRKEMLAYNYEIPVREAPQRNPPLSTWIEGKMLNEDTGETATVDRLVYFNEDCKISSIIRVTKTESFEFPGKQYQLRFWSQSLDCHGNVRALQIEFFPRSQEKRDRILEDLQQEGTICLINGRFCYEEGDDLVVYDPEYSVIQPDSDIHNLVELEEVFRLNGKRREESETGGNGRGKGEGYQ